jgi:hypothetical protein
MRRFMACVLLLATPLAADERRVLFAISRFDDKQLMIEAVAWLDPLAETPPGNYPGSGPPKAFRLTGKPGEELPFRKESDNSFASTYFRHGRSYKVIGREAKFVVSDAFVFNCMSMAALGRLSPSVALPERDWVWDERSATPQSQRILLASNDSRLRLVEPTPARDEIRAAAMSIAKKHFKSIPKPDLATLRADVRMIEVAKGQQRVVASFTAKQHDPPFESAGVHQYFFFARWDGQRLVGAVESYDAFAGAVDVDGDGWAEIITYGPALESRGFVVHSRKGGKWQRLTSGGSGC